MNISFRPVLLTKKADRSLARSLAVRAELSAETFEGGQLIIHEMSVLRLVKDLVAKNALVVFSKTSCPYCLMVHSIMSDIKAEAKFIQLDQRDDGPEIQNVLQELTGSRSVPKVFVGGSCIGGGDDTRQLYEEGKLVKLLVQAGVSVKSSKL